MTDHLDANRERISIPTKEEAARLQAEDPELFRQIMEDIDRMRDDFEAQVEKIAEANS